MNVLTIAFKVAHEGKRPLLPPTTSHAQRRLVCSCWAQESARRPTMDHVCRSIVRRWGSCRG